MQTNNTPSPGELISDYEAAIKDLESVAKILDNVDGRTVLARRIRSDLKVIPLGFITNTESRHKERD